MLAHECMFLFSLRIFYLLLVSPFSRLRTHKKRKHTSSKPKNLKIKHKATTSFQESLGPQTSSYYFGFGDVAFFFGGGCGALGFCFLLFFFWGGAVLFGNISFKDIRQIQVTKCFRNLYFRDSESSSVHCVQLVAPMIICELNIIFSLFSSLAHVCH